MARIRRHQFDHLKNSSIHHIGIEITDLEMGIRLLQGLLGFSLVHQFQFDEEKICFLQKDGMLLELVQPFQGSKENTEMHIAIQVDDIEEVMNLLNNKDEWEAPVTYPNGWTSAFMKLTDQLYIEWLKTP